jgi:hypothetical protein
MAFSRRALSATGLSVVMAGAVLVACSDRGDPLSPEQPQLPAPMEQELRLECQVNTAALTVSCGPDRPSGGASLDVIYGGKGLFANLISTNVQVVADTVMFDAAVQNLLPQAIGTTDGITPDPDGVRVFFHQLAANTGTVSVANEDGTADYTGTSQPYFQYAGPLQTNQTSPAKKWKLQFSTPGANIILQMYIRTQVPHPHGWVDVRPDSVTMPAGGADTLRYLVRKDFVGRPDPSQAVTFEVANPSVASATSSNDSIFVTGLAQGATTITVRHANPQIDPDTIHVVVNSSPVARDTTLDAIGNMTLSIPSPGLRQLITDADPGDAAVDSIIPGTRTSRRGGSATFNSDGSFTYLHAPGVTGQDTVEFIVADGFARDTAFVFVNVGDPVWYVRPGATGPGTGRDTDPYPTLAAAAAAASAGDTVLVMTGTGVSAEGGAAVLKANQTVIGQGFSGPVTRTLNGRTVALLATGGTHPQIGGTVQVGTDDTLRGLNFAASTGAALSGSSFGTLTVGESLVNAANGPALDLSTGTLNASFTSVSATSASGSGVVLTGTGGTLVAQGGSIGITGGSAPAFSVNGGTVSASWAGAISQGGTGEMVRVANHSAGTLSFTGRLKATAGSGFQFNTASGSYAFTRPDTLSGVTAGVAVVSSSGTFTFDSTAVTATGTALTVSGGAPSVTFGGSITTSAAGSRPVLVTGITGNAVTIDAAIASTAKGILVHGNTAGTVTFASTVQKSLTTGADTAVHLENNGTTKVVFQGGKLAIATTGGPGFVAATGGEVSVTGSDNTISSGSGIALIVNGSTIGSSGLTFRRIDFNGAGNGILLSGTGTGNNLLVTGDGPTPSAGSGGTLTSSAAAAVSLQNNGVVELRAMNVTGVHGIIGNAFGTLTVGSSAVTGSSGSGYSLTNGTLNLAGGSVSSNGLAAVSFTTGTLSATGTSVSATGGPALDLNGVAVSGTFPALSATATAGSTLRLLSSTGSFTADGGSLSSSGAAGTAVLVQGGSISFTYNGNVTQDANAALLDVSNNHTGTLTFATGTVNANGGTGLQLTNGDGSYNFTGNLDLSGGDAGIDIAAASAGTMTVNPAAGRTASIVSPTGVAIAVAGGSGSLSYNGNVTQASNAALLSVAGGHTGTVSFPGGTLSATNGSGLQFDNADGTYSFNGTLDLSNGVGGADAGIDVLNGSGGTFSFNANSNVSNPANQAITVQNGAGTLSFTYSGSFTKNNNAVTGILVQNNTGGSVVFNGDRTTETKVLSTGAATAVNLASNGSTSIQFAGGGLNITTTTGNGLSATGGGTLQVTGAVNTLTATGGVPLNVQNTTIGASGLSFQQISASGGANGIVLVNTGSTNGLQVTGSGSVVGSGGTIAGTSGADGAVAGNGVYMDNVSNVNLSYMLLSNHPNHAVRGNNVSGFNMTRTRITGTNGNNAGANEGSVSFDNLTGSASIVTSYIDGGFEDNVRVVNTAGTLNRLTMTTDTIGHNGTNGNDGILLDASGTATMNVTVQTSRFTGSRSNNVHYVLNGSAGGDFVFNNNVMTNNHPNKLGSDFGINVGSTSNGAMTYTISGNSVNDAGGSGIEVSHLAGGSGAMTGSITNNTVGTSGVSNSGSSAGSAIVAAVVGAGTTATHTSTITGNTLRQYTNYGIRLINRGTGQGYLNASVKNNNIAEPSPNAASFGAYSAIRAELGASSTGPDDGKSCLDISGNTLNQNAGSAQATLRIFGRFGTKTALPGLTAAGANAFLAAQNTITGTNTAVNATSTNAFQSSCPPV